MIAETHHMHHEKHNSQKQNAALCKISVLMQGGILSFSTAGNCSRIPCNTILVTCECSTKRGKHCLPFTSSRHIFARWERVPPLHPSKNKKKKRVQSVKRLEQPHKKKCPTPFSGYVRDLSRSSSSSFSCGRCSVSTPDPLQDPPGLLLHRPPSPLAASPENSL